MKELIIRAVESLMAEDKSPIRQMEVVQSKYTRSITVELKEPTQFIYFREVDFPQDWVLMEHNTYRAVINYSLDSHALKELIRTVIEMYREEQ